MVTPEHAIEYRAITLGPLVDGLRVVRGGLSPGDVVVVNGLQRVRPGMKVNVTSVSMEAASTEAAGERS